MFDCARRCLIFQVDKNDRTVKNLTIAFAALSLIIPFWVFLKTMAPTLSFWDCGEFIACANTLGIPHPPGTPFFVVLGRFFIIFTPFDNIAARTNIISVISSAFTCLVTFYLVVRVSYRLPVIENASSMMTHIGVRIAAFAAALILAFSGTFWFNAVETEVYGLAMLIMMLAIYLAIKWADEKEQGGDDKLIIFITYLLFLSIGIHLTTFLVVPAFFLFFILIDREKMKDIVFWATWLILFSVALPFYFFIGMLITFVEDNSYAIWIILMILGLFFTGFMAFGKNSNIRAKGPNYALAFWLFAVAILGYSTHVYIPIRASHHPEINENDPSSISRFISYIERKQYGQESMIARMLYRRGQLSNQFGRHENMGFGGYFVDQYTPKSWGDFSGILMILVAMVGLFAGVNHVREKKKMNPVVLLFLIFLISSVGLILYLNFSDGTRSDKDNPGALIQLEVRERDYFYTPAFVVYASMIGIGIAALLAIISEKMKSRVYSSKLLRMPLFAFVSALIIFIPFYTLGAHYKEHDRSKDMVPSDYAYNILQSCKQDGIIFTNGDNDTFPLWYLQEVEKVRKDVRVINLSLLNTDWYILQLKNQMGVKMYIEDDQIRWLPAGRRGPIIYYRPAKTFYDRVRRTNRFLTPEQDPRTGRVMRVQDQMIEQVVIANPNTDVYFSGSVPTSNRWTLEPYLIREGIVLRIDPDTTSPRYDLTLSDSLIMNTYRYRGLNDLTAYKDENNVGLTSSYPERFSELAFECQKAGDTARAISVLSEAIRQVPYYHQQYVDLKEIYKTRGDSTSSDAVRDQAILNLKKAAETWPDLILFQQFLGVFYFYIGQHAEAVKYYERAFEIQPNNSIAFRLLRDLYFQSLRIDSLGLSPNKAKLSALLNEWDSRHPEDGDAKKYYGQMKRFLNLP